MAYANPIRDIGRGQIWRDRRDGALVIIVGAGNAYVDYLPSGRGARPVTVWDGEFRKHFAPLYDRAHERRQFCMRLANLGSFTAYWLAGKAKVMACGLTRARPYNRDVTDAHLIGTYATPCDPEQFLDDLDDVLAKLNRPACTATACAG
jgi:hypothetical protein